MTMVKAEVSTFWICVWLLLGFSSVATAIKAGADRIASAITLHCTYPKTTEPSK